MTNEIDEEHVGPLATARGTSLDASQVDAVIVERHQQLMQRARLVAHGDDDRGLVVAGRRHFLAADDKEARGVVRAILDLLRQLGQAIQVGRHVAGDSRTVPLALDPLGRIGVAGNRHALDVRVVRIEPLAALCQRLGMGVDAGDLVGLGGLADQQVMVNAQLDFATDDHVVLEEAVEGVVDRAFGGILHRHHAEVDRTGSHFAEHLVDGRHRHADHRMTEVLHRRCLTEGAFRAEISDFQRVFQRQAGGHDFAEQPRHILIAQRAPVALHHALEHLSFALGAIEDGRLALLQFLHLHSRDFFGAARAIAD